MPNKSDIITPESWTEHLPLDQYFDPSKPIEVDIGCGNGRFLMAMAGKRPEANFLGIDRMLSRLRGVDQKIQLERLSNVKLLRIENSYAVNHLLPAGTINSFYIFFPDPWPKRKHHNRRMINSEFVQSIHERLKADGTVHFATDHMDYYDYSLKTFRNNNDLEEMEAFTPKEDERTNFEIVFINQKKPIGRCSFRKK